MNKKTLTLIGLIAFLLVPILIVYGADVPVNTDDTFSIVDSGALSDPNPATSDTIGLNDDETGQHPRNPAPDNNIIGLNGLAYYDGTYYNGGGPGGTYTPPTEITNLFGFMLPLIIIVAGGGFVLALARNRRYRMVGMVQT